MAMLPWRHTHSRRIAGQTGARAAGTCARKVQTLQRIPRYTLSKKKTSLQRLYTHILKSPLSTTDPTSCSDIPVNTAVRYYC